MNFYKNAVFVVRWLGNGPGQERKYKVTTDQWFTYKPGSAL